MIPIPGTAIFDDCIREGRVALDRINWDDFTSDQISFARDHVSGERLLELQKKAYMRFYRQPRIVWDLTRQTLSHRAVIQVVLRKLKMLFSRDTTKSFKPLYLREAAFEEYIYGLGTDHVNTGEPETDNSWSFFKSHVPSQGHLSSRQAKFHRSRPAPH